MIEVIKTIGIHVGIFYVGFCIGNTTVELFGRLYGWIKYRK